MKFRDGLLKIGEVFKPAMEITDQKEADEYFEALVEYYMRFDNNSRERATQLAKSNLGYFAGYYDNETRLRVERLFSCQHPCIWSSNIK